MLIKRICFDFYYETVCIWEYMFKYKEKVFNEFFMHFGLLYMYRIKSTDLKALKKKKIKAMKSAFIHISKLFVMLRYNVFYFLNFLVSRNYKTYLKHRFFRFFYKFNIFFIDFSFFVFFDFLRFFIFYRMYSRYNQILLGCWFNAGVTEAYLFQYHDVLYRASLTMLKGFVTRGSESLFFKVPLLHVPFSFSINALMYENIFLFLSFFGFVFYTKEFFNRLERFYVRIM